jgi:hypothetical protein
VSSAELSCSRTRCGTSCQRYVKGMSKAWRWGSTWEQRANGAAPLRCPLRCPLRSAPLNCTRSADWSSRARRYSCVAHFNQARGAVATLTNEHGGITTPSYVAFDPCAAARLFGDDAKRQAAIK